MSWSNLLISAMTAGARGSERLAQSRSAAACCFLGVDAADAADDADGADVRFLFLDAAGFSKVNIYFYGLMNFLCFCKSYNWPSLSLAEIVPAVSDVHATSKR